MVKVVNKRTHKPTKNDVYIGRPSPLGNPYSHKLNNLAPFKTDSREESITKFETWFHDEICNGNEEIIQAIKAIPANANLVCWCAPRACHGDVIAKIVNQLHGH